MPVTLMKTIVVLLVFKILGTLFPGSEITLVQFVVLVLSYSIRHNMTACSMEDFLNLNVLCPECW